jgi:hypothetical protein
VTDDIMNNTIHLDPTNTMFYQHADMRDPAIVGFLLVRQCSFGWLLLRLEHEHTRQPKALKPTILSQDAPFWQAILGFIRNAFIMGFAFIRGAQEPNAPIRIHQQHILDRMVFLLTTVVDFLFFGIFRSCYWSFGSIVAKKGGASGSENAVSARNWAANSAAVRAGSKSWLAKAVLRISRRSRTHLLTFD